MTEQQEKAILRFLNIQYGELVMEEKRGGFFKIFNQKGFDSGIFIIETSKIDDETIVFVNSEYVITPILNMFNAEYDETYNLVQGWFSEKYKTNCNNLVGY